VVVNSSPARCFSVRQSETASLIDEIPVLAVLATRLEGRSEVHDAGELRIKESDRLNLITTNLRRMGADVEAWEDGFSVNGKRTLRGAEIQTDGDHRITMAFAIAGLAADGRTTLDRAECADVSYPEFWKHLDQLSPGSVHIT
jgi:3-phosphoshikimate 1-carboxyvinyltransferase